MYMSELYHGHVRTVSWTGHNRIMDTSEPNGGHDNSTIPSVTKNERQISSEEQRSKTRRRWRLTTATLSQLKKHPSGTATLPQLKNTSATAILSELKKTNNNSNINTVKNPRTTAILTQLKTQEQQQYYHS